MRRTCLLLTAVLAAVMGLVVIPAQSALAASAPPSSTGQRWALKVNGKYVTAEVGDAGDQKGKLRAVSTSVTSLETFTLHTDNIDNVGYGTTISLRNEENGLYVTSEANYTGVQAGMLRARGTNTGSWERFYVVPQGGGEYALKSAASPTTSDLYLSARLNATGDDAGILRPYATSVGSWERFTFEPVGGTGATTAPPASSVTASGRHDIASWNVCANNNPSAECKLQYADSDTVGTDVAADVAGSLGHRPEAVFFQEICEKAVKPLELQLESRLGGGWDVRFAPTYYRVIDKGGAVDASLMAQKNCMDSNGTDRGAFGIALAVKDTNTWYQGYTLASPPTKEQRPALCATVPEDGTVYCNAHFSSGSYFVDGKQQGDDPDNTFRPQQAARFRSVVDTLASAGYTPFYGGDLNTTTADVSVLSSLYTSRQECGQATPDAPHTGAPTDGNNKIDYIFGPAGPSYGCEVVDPALSDHRLIHATVTF
ncbi:fascin domain-containing protein [Streptomyces sp. NPDC020800]|uniref:fascin domain-containing protein n=1 Tax=Streptomyces sp. NPDC020800 TaxID=3365092 RepID=UPI0037A6E840